MRDNIKQKRPEILIKGILFHQVNAAANNLMVAIVKIRDCGFQFVQNPPYSPGLAPLRLPPLPKPVKDMAEKRYGTVDDVINAASS